MQPSMHTIEGISISLECIFSFVTGIWTTNCCLCNTNKKRSQFPGITAGLNFSPTLFLPGWRCCWRGKVNLSWNMLASRKAEFFSSCQSWWLSSPELALSVDTALRRRSSLPVDSASVSRLPSVSFLFAQTMNSVIKCWLGEDSRSCR